MDVDLRCTSCLFGEYSRLFNSSMVRFGVNMSEAVGFFAFVSIPVWCDLEFEVKGIGRGVSCVSILVWCDLDQPAHNKKSLCFYLSIPVWCDLETFHIQQIRCFYFVSIPVWCDLERHLSSFPTYQIHVSIPVWCDLEEEFWAAKFGCSNRFNSSMVRFGAKQIAINSIFDAGFNSSMVRFGDPASNRIC